MLQKWFLVQILFLQYDDKFTIFKTNLKINQKMDTKDIIASFRQGNGSANCVSVAVIKAAVEVFGLTGVFKSVVRRDDEVTVTLQDGITLTLVQEDLDYAAQKSNFEKGSNQPLYEFAQFAFAVMAKRAQKSHNGGAVTFEEAIDSLNDGEAYARGPEWLGLEQYTQKIRRKDIWKYAGVVGASEKHCFLASFGWEDKYGTPNKISQLQLLFNMLKFQNFYRIMPTPM
jgi:hypothetical protein